MKPIRLALLGGVLLQGCSNLGKFVEEVFRERPPVPLQAAEISSDARLDSTGAIVGSFVGEGTSRRVHLLSSDTGLVAALVRRYRPVNQRGSTVWEWLDHQGTYAINVDRRRDPILANQPMVTGSPDGHTAVQLETILLHGSRCGWRGTQVEFIVDPVGSNPSLRGPVVGSFRDSRENWQADHGYRSPPTAPDGRLVDTLLAATAAAMDSVLQSRLSSRDLPLVSVAGARPEVNTLEDIDATDVLAFQLEDGRVRYAVSLREQRRTGSGTPLVAATVMVWDASLVWRQFVFAPTLLEFRYGRLRPWKSWPPFYWRRLDAMSGFAYQHDYLWMEQVDVADDAILWTVLEPRSNTVVAAAEVDGPC
ncbi:MAG TPA: hypothetical protein VL853_04980 [Gemmatimonadales bacterium]|nr:hypothetical protein [Gemmatimonadales bacterium]